MRSAGLRWLVVLPLALAVVLAGVAGSAGPRGSIVHEHLHTRWAMLNE